MRVKNYQLRDYWLIQYHILQIKIRRIVWRKVKKIANEIFGAKGIKPNLNTLLIHLPLQF